MNSGPDEEYGIKTTCTECGHSGNLFIKPEDFAALLVNASKNSEDFKALVAKAALVGRMAEVLERAKEWVEGDEATHGRKYGVGNDIRDVLADYDYATRGEKG